MNIQERFARWKAAEAAKLRPMHFQQRIGYILHYYRFWIMGLVLLLAVAFYIGDVVVQSQKEILLQGFFTNDEYDLFPADRIQKDYAATQDLTRRQRIVLDDALYIDLGGDASDYTSASNGKLIAYTLTNELDFVVTSDEVLDYYKDNMPMKDLREILSKKLQQQQGDALYMSTDADGAYSCIAVDMTGSRFVAGTGADTDPRVEHTYYLFVPESAPHTEQVAAFLRYAFRLE